MVYRSLGKDVSQRRIWERIARPGPNGKRAARTNLLAVNALHHGLFALVIQASHPWQTLTQSAAAGVRVILNHRLATDSPAGHYSVLVRIDDREVILHDPQFGPDRCLPRAELLDLWQPNGSPVEITGRVLVAIATVEKASAACVLCGSEVPLSVLCPACRSALPLRPAAALGCVQNACPMRTWQRLFCPYCDYGLSEVPHEG
jgi:hypothetical protein